MNGQSTGRYVTTTSAGEQVRAFVPDPLPPSLKLEQIASLSSLLSRAEASLSRLETASQMVPSERWFGYAFTRKEALLSAEIEGTQATLVDVLSWERADQSGGSDPLDLQDVSNVVLATEHGFAQLDSPAGTPVSVRMLHDCHRLLLEGSRGASKDPGEFRRSQNWVGGSRPGNAVFVPPPPNLVPALVSDLERYIHSEDELAPLLRVALAHAQFETIHPYLDGNGRLGRLLIALLLKHWGLLSRPLLFLSVFLREHRSTYYERLNAIRQSGDWMGWLTFFLEGVVTTADRSSESASTLFALFTRHRRLLLRHESATVSALRLLELLPEYPVFTMPVVVRLLSVTKPTAAKAIDALQQAGIVSEVGSRKRDRLYGYSAYLAVLAE